GVPGTTYTLAWTITSPLGVCAPSSDEVIVTLDAAPTVASAGADQAICGPSATLAANTPVVGQGKWTIQSGSGGGFLDDEDPATTFSGGPGETYVLRWTISNGVCADSFDEVTIHFDEAPTTADAGGDQEVCGNSVTLAANTPATGTGKWSVVSGTGGSFVDKDTPNTTLNGDPGTTHTLAWTITSPLGVCAPSSDEVIVTLDAAPTVASAGADQAICGPSATLAANTPVVGQGKWTIQSGSGGGFLDDEDPATTFSGGPGETYVLRWTISNGVCADSFDEVTIHFDEAPTTADAGGDQEVCGNSVTLAANTPATGTGKWSVVSGTGGSFVDNEDPNTTFNGVPGTTYTLAWTITSPLGVCAPGSDEVIVTLDAAPTVASAGADQTICGPSATLAANTPVVGQGKWTIQSGSGGGFLDDEDPATTFSGDPGETYVLRWTISNGVCADSFDEVTIHFDEAPTTADAGGDQEVCGNSATLAANTPATGTGKWSVVSGAGGAFVDNEDPNTTFNGVPGTTYTLAWTISSPLGVCAPSSDEVVIRLDAAPTVASAGADQTVCGPSATLAANTPVVGQGKWTIQSGSGGGFLDDEDPATTFSGDPGETYVLRWTISNGVCADSFDEVTIHFDEAPTTADAGGDQEVCGNSATLAANTPLVGAGKWSVVSGTGGSF